MTHPAQPRPMRRFSADDILYGRINLDAYPLRYICVTPPPKELMENWAATRNMERFSLAPVQYLDMMLSAIEFLETRGWELVSLEQGGLLAFLRRVQQ